MSFETVHNNATTCPKCQNECTEAEIMTDGICDTCLGVLYAEGAYDPFEDDDLESDGDFDEDGSWVEDDEDFDADLDASRDDFDDDFPESQEWDDVYGGDDWDHGQFDMDNDW